METKVEGQAPVMTEVPMVLPKEVELMVELAAKGWGTKRIARELGLARNTVRKYTRDQAEAAPQQHLPQRCLDEGERTRVVALFESTAAGNAVVVQELLQAQGLEASVRTIQRVVRPQRQALRAAQAASLRFETEPGQQLQIDFGQKLLKLAGAVVRVYVFVAVLGFSRRLFVQPFLCERQDEWREGLMNAFRRFGGVTRTVLIDNAKALVLEHDAAGRVTLQPPFAAYCRDLGVEVRACRPYRARTKGKTESGVKYVKHNGLAGREFGSFAQLQAHLTVWMDERDERVHGTTHEPPRERFEREEQQALRPLPTAPVAVRERRLVRKVANDCLVDVDTVRYSVPHRLVGTRAEVAVAEQEVRIFSGGQVVATHRRSQEPHARVVDPAHYAGLWRGTAASRPVAQQATLVALGRDLQAYDDVVQAGGAQ